MPVLFCLGTTIRLDHTLNAYKMIYDRIGNVLTVGPAATVRDVVLFCERLAQGGTL